MGAEDKPVKCVARWSRKDYIMGKPEGVSYIDVIMPPDPGTEARLRAKWSFFEGPDGWGIRHETAGVMVPAEYPREVIILAFEEFWKRARADPPWKMLKGL